MTNCLPTMWYQYLSSVWQYCKLSLNLSQPSLLLPLVKFFNASHPGTAHTHTHTEGILVLATKFPKETSSRLIHWDDYKEYVAWYSHVLTFLPLFAASACSHVIPCPILMGSGEVAFDNRIFTCCFLALDLYSAIHTHTHSFPSAGRTPSSWLAYPSSRTTDCGEQTNKHDLKTFCTMNSQISPDLCLPWHDCYNQQRQPWDYTKITWDIIIKSVGKIRHWNIFWVYLQQPLWSPPCRGSHHRDATATWAPKPSPRSNLNAFLGTLDDTFGPYPR